MYVAPGQGQGQTAPRGQNFDVNRKALSLYPFVANFKEISFKSDFIQFFFHYLIHVYSPGAGDIQSPGDKVLMATETSCHCGHLLLVSNHRRNSVWKIHWFTFFSYKSRRDQIWPCRKTGQGQSRVIIWANFVVLEHPMMHTKIQGYRPLGSGEEDFFLGFYHLGHVTRTIWANFRSPIP